jgi:hypothetical protein
MSAFELFIWALREIGQYDLCRPLHETLEN